MDLRAREVEVGLLQVGLSRENQRVQTFELGFQAGHLLTLRLQIGLGLGHLRAGHAVVGGQGGDAFFGDVTWLAQGLGAAEIELERSRVAWLAATSAWLAAIRLACWSGLLCAWARSAW